MLEKVSYCGILCDGCPVLWATKETDAKMRKKIRKEIAAFSNQIYATNLTADEISDCEGCKSLNGKLFEGCTNCIMRNCCIEKQYPNCAYCNDYPCEALSEIFAESNDSKTRLDFIRSMLK